MKKTLNVEIGARIREAREQLQMSRETLARLTGISALFLGYVECGQKGMSLETLVSFCDALHITADYLLFGKMTNPDLSNDAQRLLQRIPTLYLPLAADSLRTLIVTISMAHAERAHTPAQQAEQPTLTIQTAAQSGEHKSIPVSSTLETKLECEMALLKCEQASLTR